MRGGDRSGDAVTDGGGSTPTAALAADDAGSTAAGQTRSIRVSSGQEAAT